MKILIAEDDEASLRVLQLTLEKAGHEVVTAEDGARAWASFDSDPVRVVISDWMMPELTGLDLCRRIRARPLTRYTYFIMLTARAGDDDCDEAMKAGVDDFLGKPPNRVELFNRLHVADRILGLTSEIEQLRSILPICMYCKKIRDELGEWQPVEHYISTHAGAQLSHGCCPECVITHLRPSMDPSRLRKRNDP